MNYQKYTEPAGGTMTSSSQAGSRNCASHTALQEKGSVKKTNATCGRTCLEQYEKLGQSTWWGKMFGELLVGTGDWYSTRCKLTWKLKVTPSSRVYFQLAVSTLPIEGKECGLLPTVKATEIAEDYDKIRARMVASGNPKNVGKTVFNLATQARAGLLPTPCARDFGSPRGAGAQEKKGNPMDTLPNLLAAGLLPTPRVSGSESYDSRAARKGHDVAMSYLESNIEFQVKNGMLPTCTTRDWKGARTIEALERAGRDGTNSLPDAFAQPGKTSQLNPRFVGEMMGFPVNWTELPFLNGEVKVLKPTEMPSYL